MYIRVACADDYAVVAVEQQITVETIGPSLHRDENIDGQREEIEADVLVVERIVYAIGHLIEKLQEDAPVAGFCRGDQQSEQTCATRDYPGPRQSIAYEREQIRRRRSARRVPRGRSDRLCRLPPGKTHSKPSVQPKYDGGCRQNG